MRLQHYLQHLPCPHAVNSKSFLQVPFTSSIAEPELGVQAPGQTAIRIQELVLLWIRRYLLHSFSSWGFCSPDAVGSGLWNVPNRN